MYLIERHLAYRLGIVAFGLYFAITHAVVLVRIFQLLPHVTAETVPASVLLDAYLGALPNVTYLVAPLITAMALILVMNHLIAARTIMVLYSTGMSVWRMAVPGIVVAVAVTALSLPLAHLVAPAGARLIEDTKFRVQESSSQGMLPQGQFVDVVPGKLTIQFRHRIDRDTLGLVFIADRRDPEVERILTAREAHFTRVGSQTIINLGRGHLQNFPRGGEASKIVAYDRYVLVVDSSDQKAQRPAALPYERDILSLLDPTAAERAVPELRRRLLSEAHKRLVTPFLTLAYCVVILGVMLSRFAFGWRRTQIAVGLFVLFACEHIAILIMFDTGVRYSELVLAFGYLLVGAHFPLGAWLLLRRAA